MRLVAAHEGADCLKSQHHSRYCTGTNHVCYRCGFLFGPCDCARLGTLLDY